MDNTNPIKPEPKRDELGRFGPGNNANPAGRPPGVSFTERIKEIFLNDPKKFEATCKYYMDDPRMKELLWKMIDGMPKQQIGGDKDSPIEVVIKRITNENQD